jgi:hypothetical protein
MQIGLTKKRVSHEQKSEEQVELKNKKKVTFEQRSEETKFIQTGREKKPLKSCIKNMDTIIAHNIEESALILKIRKICTLPRIIFYTLFISTIVVTYGFSLSIDTIPTVLTISIFFLVYASLLLCLNRKWGKYVLPKDIKYSSCLLIIYFLLLICI